MEKHVDAGAEVVEIGTASSETQGQVGPVVDFMLGQAAPGLADE